MINVSCEKVGDWSASLNREGYELDPHTIELNNHRYHLQAIDGTWYSLWDSEEKKNIVVKGDTRWENWKKAHKGEYCTDF